MCRFLAFLTDGHHWRFAAGTEITSLLEPLFDLAAMIVTEDAATFTALSSILAVVLIAKATIVLTADFVVRAFPISFHEFSPLIK